MTGPSSTHPLLAAPDLFRRDLWHVIRHRWLYLVAGVALGCGAGYAYWHYTPPTYESAAQCLVMIKDPSLPTTGMRQTQRENGVSEDTLATHMQIVQSKQIVSAALQRSGLAQAPSIVEALEEDQTPVDYVISRLRVTRGGMGQARSAHVLNVAIRHSSPEDAQKLVTALVEEYQRFLDEKFQDVGNEAARLIAEAREEIEQDLKQAEAKYIEARKAAPLLWDGEKSTNMHRLAYEQIQTELSSVRIRATEAESKLHALQNARERVKEGDLAALDVLSLVDEGVLGRLGLFAQIRTGQSQARSAEMQATQPERIEGARAQYASLLTLLARESTLLGEFGPNHPEVIALRRQIEAVRTFIEQRTPGLTVTGQEREAQTVPDELDLSNPAKLLGFYAQLLQHDIEAMRQREAQLVAIAEREEAAAKTLVTHELEDATRSKQIARKQELYSAVVERLREINLSKDYSGFINEIIAEPTLGELVWPKLPICLALGGFLGLVLGTASAAFAGYRYRLFRSMDEISVALEIGVLGELRKIRRSRVPRGKRVAAELCTLYQPGSPEAEAFRRLRTSLFFAAQSEQAQVLAFTSPTQGDGKSTTIGNLAVSMAQSGRRVLLVDCDLRRPCVHRLLPVDQSIGLTSILLGQVEPWDAVQDIEIPNLSVISAGPAVANPAEMLGLPEFKEFLRLARERYDFVLLDCPPVLAVADACIVAAQADKISLVVRVSRNTRAQAMQARAALASVGARLLGVIVNAWDASAEFDDSKERGYYGYYGTYGNAYAASPAATSGIKEASVREAGVKGAIAEKEAAAL